MLVYEQAEQIFCIFTFLILVILRILPNVLGGACQLCNKRIWDKMRMRCDILLSLTIP